MIQENVILRGNNVEIELNRVVENIRIILPDDIADFAYEYSDLADKLLFRVDYNFKIRKALGSTASESEKDNVKLVPPEDYSFGIDVDCYSNFTATLELPNPSLNLEFFQKVRNVMIKELQKRVLKFIDGVRKEHNN